MRAASHPAESRSASGRGHSLATPSSVLFRLDHVNQLVYIPPMRRKPHGLPGLGRRISDARALAGLTQEGLGAAVGVDRQTVYRWEAEEREPAAGHVAAVVRACGCGANWLLGVDPMG